MIIFYELSVSAYEILPIWGIYWYYYSTTFKHTKDKIDRYGDRNGDHNITTIDEDEYYEGTLLFTFILFISYYYSSLINSFLIRYISTFFLFLKKTLPPRYYFNRIDIIFNELLDDSGESDNMSINMTHNISIGKYNSYLAQDQSVSQDASFLLLAKSDGY